MNFQNTLFLQYKNIMNTTNIQVCYQEIISLIKYIRLKLEKEMSSYHFMKQVIENQMDFSYFQVTDQKLKQNGLKIQVIFVHKTCMFEVWMSGYNRKIQCEYFNKLKIVSCPFERCENPEKNDYIVRVPVKGDICSNNVGNIIQEIEIIIDILKNYFIC